MKFFLFLSTLLCLGWMSCKSSADKKKPLVLNTMKLIMWDMLKADEWYIRKTVKDSTLKNKKENIRLYEQVFALHNITRNQFYTSYKYYEAHPVEFKILLDSVDAFAHRERYTLSSPHGQAP